MSSIIFDEGYRTFDINGDPNRVLRVNPSDIGILDRMMKAYEDMQKEVAELGDIKISNTGEAISDAVEVVGTIRKLNRMLRMRFDEIFYEGAADIVFGTMNPLATAGGKTVFENFMEAFIKEIKPMLEDEQKQTSENLKKYKDQYDRFVANKP